MTFKWGRAYVLAGAAVFLSTFAVPANAISFTGTFNITSDAATDPALVIVTNPALSTNFAADQFQSELRRQPTAMFNQPVPDRYVGKLDPDRSDTLWTEHHRWRSASTRRRRPFGGPVTGQTRGRARISSVLSLIRRVGLGRPQLQLAFGNGRPAGHRAFRHDFVLRITGQPDSADVKA